MTCTNNRFRRGRNGFATIYVTFTCLILLPIVGLAIDFAVLYNVKARLQTAVDAAAVGSGTMLQASTNLGDPAQVATIQDAAQRFFNANYPSRYWGSTQLSYASTPSEDPDRVRTVYVNAAMSVPMLFMRVIGIQNSTVAAEAAVKVRFVSMMVVVDRSGSVVRGGADGPIRAALTQFISDPATSPFADGRDVIGMVSFSGNSKLDLAPVTTFRSGASTFDSAVSNLPFTTSGNTNTAEGLYQGYNQLRLLNHTGALNVIVLLTDGRPSGFSSDHFQVSPGSTCLDKSDKSGFIAAYVGADATQWPPPQTTPNGWGLTAYGIYDTTWNCPTCETTMAANLAGCAMSADPLQMPSDMPNFPATDRYGNSTTGPYFQGEGTRTDDPRAVRYAAFNAADNMAMTIRTDLTIRPVLFVIGLNEAAGEPLDADFLARLANDPIYNDVNGNSVYQPGQTPGKYYNVRSADLGAAFQDIASQILRLAQ